MLTAPLIGFVLGFFGSIPVAGPVGVLAFNRGLDGRSRGALSLATGSAIVEAAYAYLAFWGFSQLLTSYPWIRTATSGAAALILLGLGVHFAFRRNDPDAAEHPPDPTVGVKRSFVLGFTITALNPTLLATWPAALTMVHSFLEPFGVSLFARERALSFSAGVCVGIVSWFALLLALLGRYKRRIPQHTIDRIVRGTGFVLIGFGVWFGVRFVLTVGDVL
ncbi:MAG: LysE family transporter [Myxococcales bacterium]